MLFKVCPTLSFHGSFSQQHDYLRSFGNLPLALNRQRLVCIYKGITDFSPLVNFTLVESSPHLRWVQVWRWVLWLLHWVSLVCTCMYSCIHVCMYVCMLCLYSTRMTSIRPSTWCFCQTAGHKLSVSPVVDSVGPNQLKKKNKQNEIENIKVHNS